MNIVQRLKTGFGSLPFLFKIIAIALIGLTIWYAVTKINASKNSTPQYQTEQIQKGTLILSVSASGQVANTNSTPVTTLASGVVKNLYVKDGDSVTAGQAIADIELDQPGKQSQAQALASYQGAQNNVNNAQASYFSLQSSLFTAWSKFINLSENSYYTNGDGSPNTQHREEAAYISTHDDWLSAEAKYKNQALAVSQVQNSLTSSWLTYQQSSPTIYAPISGKISGLSLQVGSVIISTSGTATSTTNAQSTKVGNIVTEAFPVITVNLTQIDVPTIHIGDKVSITFDALSTKSFTGKVVSIDTSGSVSSGVTSYPALIMLDTKSTQIYPNMSATANIITQSKTDVLLVPNSAVQTSNGETTVRVMKNNVMESVPVVTGLVSDTQTEIVSGINEGDTVVTNVITTTAATTTQTSSVFGGLRLGGGLGGGNNVRTTTRTTTTGR